jgi:hypothetical protein
MSVKKPIEKDKFDHLDNLDLDSLITKGAPVKADRIKDSKLWQNINFRLSTEMLIAVDRAVSRSVGITRTGWILQAIDEKLKRM